MPLDGQELGHYRLLKVIGSGGMGEVYLAEDKRIGRRVAIKVIRTEVSPYPDVRATQQAARLFQREMKAITALDHPHILPLYDFGEETIHKNTLIYMVMPFRREGSLADWLQQHSSSELLLPEDVAHFIRQAADALQDAHDHQLIHLDVKPSNFLIRSRTSGPNLPDVLLADFGIAKFMTATATSSQSIRGTPAYMAPEQWDGQPVETTDQYSLAVTAYQLLTGRPPFLGGPGRVMRQHFTAQPEPPSTFNSRIPPALDAVILRALAKKPEARFTSITDFARAFQQALHSVGDIRATLAISRTEALTGNNRTLTLPNRRQVIVTIPAGAQDGQIMRLEGQGEPYYDDGPRGALILTISIAPTEKLASSSDNQSDESLSTSVSTAPSASDTAVTLLSASAAHHEDKPVPIFHESNPAQMASTVLSHKTKESAKSYRGLFTGKKLLFIVLVLLIVAGSLGLLYTTVNNQATTGNAHAPSTLQMSATNATGTAEVATAVAQGKATATAEVAETATFAAQNPNPYPPHNGTLAFYDSLHDGNSTVWNYAFLCTFSGGTLHVTKAPQGWGYTPCNVAYTNYFINFTIEVQMKIINGNCGGLVFRSYYFFQICQDGTYRFGYFTSNDYGAFQAANGNPTFFPIQTLKTNSSSAIQNGVNQSNVIAVSANGSAFDPYVNNQKIDTINDGTYQGGSIGFTADFSNPSEVEFNNVKMWSF
jgi:eukaryotic-like serine/threonine-protein kinase